MPWDLHLAEPGDLVLGPAFAADEEHVEVLDILGGESFLGLRGAEPAQE